MKKVTNKTGLPEPLVRVIEKISNQYSAGDSDITATGLISPPRLEALKRKHAPDITEDAVDLLYSVVGTSIHSMLEEAGKELADAGYIAEKRYYMDMAGWKIGAQVDLFHSETGVLQDYKNTSVYSVKDGPKEEYAQQLNIGAEILRQNGFTVKKLQIVAILRDWSKGEYERELSASKTRGYNTTKYPSKQVVVLDVPLVPSAEVQEWIAMRIIAHKEAREGNLPECTPEERWAREDTWAVVKKGQKKAFRLHDDSETANVTLQEMGSAYQIEHRPGKSVRCESYCSVKDFCTQYQKTKEKL